jgi:hypothetical protein
MITVVTWDDIDAAEDRLPPLARTVKLGWDGIWYELDLNDLHQQELWEAIEPFLRVARRERKVTEQAKPQAITAGADVPKESGVYLYHAVGVSMRAYMKGLRKWAAEHGDPLELRDYPGGSKGYSYLARHYQGYENWLSDQDRLRMTG